jgi:pimeloyl-ACP methyl ester carboxylesterase
MNADAYTMSWQANGIVKYLPVKSGSIRYLDVGQGQPLLLIHTLRTQLDYFQKVIPLLPDGYRILAIDLPGHGYSSIPSGARFDEPFFRKSVVECIEKLDLRNLILVGESIGGVLALTVSATLPGRINRIFAFNPYDYGDKFGGGIRRGQYGFIIALFSLFGGFTFETALALKLVLSGGFADPTNLPSSLLSEFVRVGNQKGYRQAEYLLFKHWRTWLDAKKLYAKVKVPITLIDSEQDWSYPPEREDRKKYIPDAEFILIATAGHFSALESPKRFTEIIIDKLKMP